MAAGVQGIAQDVAALKDAHAQGVTLEKDAADALITGLNDAILEVDQAIQRGQRQYSRDSIKIGSSKVAKACKPVYQAVMDDDVQGGYESLVKYKQELDEAVKTVKACARDTRDTDAGNASGMNGTAGG
jgi:hypothetical protein